MGRKHSLIGRLAGVLALVAVLLHGGIVSLHATPSSDPLSRLMALGAFCFAAGSTAALPSDLPAGDDGGARLPPKCPLCTALAAVQLAPPPQIHLPPRPPVVRIDPATQVVATPVAYRPAQARARAPPLNLA